MYYNVVSPSTYGPMILNRHDSVVGYNIGMLGAWMPHELELLRHLATWAHAKRERVWFVDVGANVGMHSLAVACLRLPNLRCFAIEAQRATYYQLCGTLALNGLSHVVALHRVAGAHTGDMADIPEMQLSKPANFGAFAVQANTGAVGFDGGYTGNVERVASIALDDLLPDRTVADAVILKIDIEGMEPHALAGAKALIAATEPLVFAEYGQSSREAVIQAMRDAFAPGLFNYRVFEMPEKNLLMLPAWCDVVVQGVEPDASPG